MNPRLDYLRALRGDPTPGKVPPADQPPTSVAEPDQNLPIATEEALAPDAGGAPANATTSTPKAPTSATSPPKSPKTPGQKSPAPALGTQPQTQESGYRDDLQQSLHAKLVHHASVVDVLKFPLHQRREILHRAAESLLDHEAPHLSYAARREILEDLFDEVLGYGPLEKLLRDQSISDIVVNGAKQVYVERRGRLEKADIHFRDDEHLLDMIRRIVTTVGRRVDDSSPMVDARLPDGSRVNAIIPPLALKGPMLSIRRFGAHRLNIADLITLKALPNEVAQFLESSVRARLNIVVSGGTGSGKTTLLNALSAYIPAEDRVITIEDTAELQLQQEHVGSLESRPPNAEGKGQVTIRDLLRNALRMRPNRIVIGECRGAEALDMLQAMNTGHAGSMTTLHANTPRDALGRLEMMVMMSGVELPLRAIRQQISSAVNLIVQVSRVSGGGRKLVSITEVTGMEGDVITLQELFRFHQIGIDPAGRAKGNFEAAGVRPNCEPRFTEMGLHFPTDMFRHRVIQEC
ncbi:MAG: pilus assembly protein CpaF [Planctomycetaceae bacterium]|nr:pilus assembly protein CpaF [Planctomycetaceae bacterium]